MTDDSAGGFDKAQVELAVRQRGSGIPMIWGHNLPGSKRLLLPA
jgi:hypothetical protein